MRTSVARLFAAAAWADKYEGAVHQPPMRGIALAHHEPLGVIGIACPDEKSLLAFLSLAAPALAEHDDMDAIWYFGPAAGDAAVERASAGNLKRVWSDHGRRRDWYSNRQAEGREVLRHAVNVKNIWAPYGE